MPERVSLGQAHEVLQARYGSLPPESKFNSLINRYVSDPNARQAIGLSLATELLYDPTQISVFTATYQAKIAGLDPRHQKDIKALRSLDQTVKDQLPLQVRSSFDEFVSSPERMGMLIDMTMAAAQGTSSRTDSEMSRAASTDPIAQANLYANYMLVSLFGQVGWFERGRSEQGAEPTTLPQMKQVQKQMVDVMYSISQYAAQNPGNIQAHTFLWSVASAHIPHMSDIRSPAQGLLHTALYSDEPVTVAKALYVELVTHLIDQYQGRNDFVSRQEAIRENHPTAIRFARAMKELDPQAIAAGNALADNMRERMLQKNDIPADDAAYLDPHITPLEEEVLKFNPRIWYDFLHFYSDFSQSKSIPVTFPNGLFRGIGHESGGNEERAARLVATAWTAEQPVLVTNHLAIEDAFRLLQPPTNAEGAAQPVSASVKLNGQAGEMIDAGIVPLDLKIGTHKLNLQLGSDSRLYFLDGEPVETGSGNGPSWVKYVTEAARSSCYRFLAKNETEIPAELIPLLAGFMKPELSAVAFAQVERLLDATKKRLADPDRGLLRDGITAKIIKGQLPGDNPITRIHFDQTGSVATLYIGKTKLLAKIDLHLTPPRIVSVNGYMLNHDRNGDIWLEYAILAPLKAIACTDAVAEEKDDSMLLEGTEHMPRPEAIRKTREVVRKRVGHRFQLPFKNGRPTKYTEAQRQRVLTVANPLIGYPILDLEEYNRTHRNSDDPYAQYWDYAIYREDTYEQHQQRHAVVMVPHAYDGISKIIESEKASEV